MWYVVKNKILACRLYSFIDVKIQLNLLLKMCVIVRQLMKLVIFSIINNIREYCQHHLSLISKLVYLMLLS